LARIDSRCFAARGGPAAAHIPTLAQGMRRACPTSEGVSRVRNNPLTTYGNAKQVHESLLKLDLLVVADLFMTRRRNLPTSSCPAASWPELNQLAGLPTVAANVVLAQQKAVQIGECKADEEIFIELARKMNLPLCTEPLDEVLESQLASGCGIPPVRVEGEGLLQGSVPVREVQGRRLQDTHRQD